MKKRAKCLKPERPHPPKLVCMHTLSTSTCMNILSQFYFLNPMHGPNGKFGQIWRQAKRSKISETGVATPTKIGFHAFRIKLYLHNFFDPILFDSIWFYLILFDSIFCPLWTIYSPQCQKGSLASQTQPPSGWGLGLARETSIKDILPSLERSKFRLYRYRREYSV